MAFQVLTDARLIVGDRTVPSSMIAPPRSDIATNIFRHLKLPANLKEPASCGGRRYGRGPIYIVVGRICLLLLSNLLLLLLYIFSYSCSYYVHGCSLDGKKICSNVFKFNLVNFICVLLLCFNTKSLKIISNFIYNSIYSRSRSFIWPILVLFHLSSQVLLIDLWDAFSF